LHEGQRFTFFEDPKAPWTYYWFKVEGPQANKFVQACGLPASAPWLAGASRPKLINSAREIWSLLDQSSAGTPYAVTRALFAFAEAAGRSEATHSVAPPRLSERIAAVVDAQLHTGINVNELAAALGVSRATIHNATRKAFGMPPVKYLTRCRLERARDLLNRGDLTVAEVAAATGFNDAKYFMRVFKRAHGKTCGGFRR
jgi:AraC-like DNA-binding protein